MEVHYAGFVGHVGGSGSAGHCVPGVRRLGYFVLWCSPLCGCIMDCANDRTRTYKRKPQVTTQLRIS